MGEGAYENYNVVLDKGDHVASRILKAPRVILMHNQCWKNSNLKETQVPLHPWISPPGLPWTLPEYFQMWQLPELKSQAKAHFGTWIKEGGVLLVEPQKGSVSGHQKSLDGLGRGAVNGIVLTWPSKPPMDSPTCTGFEGFQIHSHQYLISLDFTTTRGRQSYLYHSSCKVSACPIP